MRGPHEFVVAIKNGNDIKQIDIELFENVYPILVKHRLENEFVKDHPKCLMNRIIGSVGELNVHLISIPTTIFELFYIREYLVGRVSSPFVSIGDSSSMFDSGFIMGCRSPFIFDHKVKSLPENFSTSDFNNKVEQYHLEQFTAFLNFELNNAFISFLNKFQYKEVQSNLSFWTGNLLDELCNDIQSIEYCKSTTISLKYTLWPFHYFFSDISEEFSEITNSIIESSVALEHYQFLYCSIMSIKSQLNDSIKSMNLFPLSIIVDNLYNFIKNIIDQYNLELNSGEENINNNNNNNNNKYILYYLYLKYMWPILIDEIETMLSLKNEINSDTDIKCKINKCDEELFKNKISIKTIKKIKRQMDPTYRIDSCVYCFRKSNYLNQNFIKSIVELEVNEKEESIYLYRGSSDITNDLPIINPTQQSISFKKTSNLKVNPAMCHSLSFGKTLFSGIFYDRTATAYNSIRKKNKKGYIIKLLINEINIKEHKVNHFFWIPTCTTMMSLMGIGELWHPRSKLYIPIGLRNIKTNYVSGIHGCSYNTVPSFLTTEIEVTNEEYQQFVASRISIIKN